MDLRFTEEQELIRTTAREMLETRCPATLVREMETDARGYSPELWKSMAELGWMGVVFPEACGGLGQSFLDLCVLIEELGRFRVAEPFVSTVVLGGLPIARFGSEEQKGETLAALVRGERLLSWAESEPGHPAWGEGPVHTVARETREGYRLDGEKLFVPYAHVASDVLVVARTGDTAVTVFLVDPEADGVTLERLETIGGDHQHRVKLRDVRVPKERLLGNAGEGAAIVRAVHEWGAAAKCAEMIGGAGRVLEMTLRYATDRVQFGQPIGAFQAVQHHCANMAIDVDSSRFLAYEAIWRLSEGLEATTEVSMAKAWVSDAAQRVCARAHQVHGAIGFTREHDLQLFSRHARAAEMAFGDGDYHRELVARALSL